jgi:maltose alpha-D-glucosyltransferase/alpha-amylase
VRDRRAGQILARVKGAGPDAVLHDAGSNRAFAASMLDAVARRRKIKGARGHLLGCPTPALRRLLGDGGIPQAIPMSAEQSNTSIRFQEKLILKLVRKVEPGIHPDVEIPRALAAKAKGAALVAAQCGSLEYRKDGELPMTIAVVQAFVPNGGDAWRYTLDILARYFERVAARLADEPRPPETSGGPLALARVEPPEAMRERIGVYLESARLIGRRTGELHATLASFKDAPDFAPEPFTPFYQRSLYQTMRNHVASALGLLRQGLGRLPEAAREEAREVLARERTLLARFRAVAERRISALRTRVHGDYHLGQVLFTGRDFVIIDFEGEPALPMSERRRKRSPLRDVAGMIRSFDYASHFALDAALRAGVAAEAEREKFEAHAAYWSRWVSATFLASWLETVGEAGVLPKTQDELELLLDVFLLNKAISELAYELQNRPDWVWLPLRGILGLLPERA